MQVREVDGTGAVTTTHPEVVVEHGLDEAPVPFFPRANHGDLVELTLFNSLGSFPADPSTSDSCRWSAGCTSTW